MIVQAAGGIRVMVMLKDYRLDLEAMARAITPMTKLVFIANPNNPTATIVTADEVEHFMSRVPERTIVVFDEAYVEFALGPDFPETLKTGRVCEIDFYYTGATRENARWEAADLLYHAMVEMRSKGVTLAEVVAELESRHLSP